MLIITLVSIIRTMTLLARLAYLEDVNKQLVHQLAG